MSCEYRPLSGYPALPTDPTPPERLFPMPIPPEAAGRDMWYTGLELIPSTVVAAYRQGFFPWEGDPLGWCSPTPRFVLYPDSWHVPRSLRRTLRKSRLRIRFDQNPRGVVESCMVVERPGQPGSWITPEMVDVYSELASYGYMHTAEARAPEDGRLVGGLYGMLIGSVFVGDSMFSRERDASKITLAVFGEHLFQNGVQMIDCQVYSSHLAQFGAVDIGRPDYLQQLYRYRDQPAAIPKPA